MDPGEGGCVGHSIPKSIWQSNNQHICYKLGHSAWGVEYWARGVECKGRQDDRDVAVVYGTGADSRSPLSLAPSTAGAPPRANYPGVRARGGPSTSEADVPVDRPNHCVKLRPISVRNLPLLADIPRLENTSALVRRQRNRLM